MLSPLLIAAALAGGAAPVKPWTAEGDVGCHWWLSREDGRSHRASIGQGDGVVLSFSDPAFLAWSDLERPRVELIFNHDPKRRVEVEGWATHGPPDSTSSSFGLYLDAEARRAMGAATRIELRRDGKTIIDIPLAATPTQAELDACVPPPKTEDSDEE